MRVWKHCALLLLTVATQGQQVPFKMEVAPPRLSNHQRLRTAITAKFDGKELVARQGDGDLLIGIAIRDQQGHSYRAGGKIDLREVTPETRNADVFYTQGLLVMPGDYHVSIHVKDTINGQRGSGERTFHVDPLGGDPLPEMWGDLPAVEFWPALDGPDRWFLPSVTGRMHLTLDTRRPVKIDLLVNATPTERGRAGRLRDANMNALIPALKAIFQTEVHNGSLDLAMLDLSRRRVTFSQNNSSALNWPRLKSAFEADDPNKIDIQSLASRDKEGEFFVNEVGRRVEGALGPDEPMHVLIVLSAPMAFRGDVHLHRIEMPANANCKLFYIRYDSGRSLRPIPLGVVGPGQGGRAAAIPPLIEPMEGQQDELENTLKPLKPHLYDVASPMDFRKALASMLAEISRY